MSALYERVLGAFRLNPFDILDLRMDATKTDLSKQFRKVSLLIHPDKCNHERAKEAFELANAAYKMVQNEEEMKFTRAAIEQAKENVLAERTKEVQRNNALSTLHRLREGEEDKWKQSNEFHYRWKIQTQKVLTNMEWKKRRFGKRIREEEERVRKNDEEEKQKAKDAQKRQKTWEEQREERVGGWRQFVKTKESKKKKKKAQVLGAV